MRDADAASVSRVLIEGDMMGIPTHGVLRLSTYIERLTNGAVDPMAVPLLEYRAAALAMVDGRNALGPVVAEAAVRAGLKMTAKTGIAYVGCHASNHLGALIPYALEAVDAGYVMIAGTGASATMPPFGGSAARIGNNPLCIAAPCPDAPHFMLDMAMSVAARGKIRMARDADQPIPEGWAVDADGQPTTDPARALDGLLVAVGAHKGSGLSMGVDILANVMNGAESLDKVGSWSDAIDQPQHVGHFFLFIDAGRLIGADAFLSAMGRFRDTIHATPAADPDHPVIMAGEREQALRTQALIKGVPVKADVLNDVRRLAGA